MGRKPEGTAEKAFKQLGKKIDQLLVDARGLKDKAAHEFEDSIEELKRNRDSIEEEIQRLKKDERWTEAKQHLENAGKEIKKAFDKAFSKNRKSDQEKAE